MGARRGRAGPCGICAGVDDADRFEVEAVLLRHRAREGLVARCSLVDVIPADLRGELGEAAAERDIAIRDRDIRTKTLDRAERLVGLPRVHDMKEIDAMIQNIVHSQETYEAL